MGAVHTVLLSGSKPSRTFRDDGNVTYHTVRFCAVSHMWLVSTGNVAGGMEAPNVLFYSVFVVNSGYRLAPFGEGKEEGKQNEEHKYQAEDSNGGWGKEWAGGFPSFLPHSAFWKDGEGGVGM